MNSTHAFSGPQADLRDFPALRRSFRGSRAKALADFKLRNDRAWNETASGREPRKVPGHAQWKGLEVATMYFREDRARSHREKARDSREAARALEDVYARGLHIGRYGSQLFEKGDRSSPFDDSFSEAWGIAVREEAKEHENRARWHEQRATGQRDRFANVRACCTRKIRVACNFCGTDHCEMHARCGVVRICASCAKHAARERQQRIARARVKAIQTGAEAGLFIANRRGGRWTEKMLTLTVPHVTLEQCSGEVAEAATNTVEARLAALRLAWPRFMRRVRRWLIGTKRRPRHGVRAVREWFAYYRLLEWTRGHDGLGHPHFHTYVFSPWLDVEKLRAWWAESLIEVGVPLPYECKRCATLPLDGEQTCGFGRGVAHVILDLRRLYGLTPDALRELMKSGNRLAIEGTLGRLRALPTPGMAAIEYAHAWSLSEAFPDAPVAESGLDVQRDLFIALEGRRLAQGSRGFVPPAERGACGFCGRDEFSAAIVTELDEVSSDDEEEARSAGKERGPPYDGEEEQGEERGARRASGEGRAA